MPKDHMTSRLLRSGRRPLFLLLALATAEAVFLGAVLSSSHKTPLDSLFSHSELGVQFSQLSSVSNLVPFGDWGFTVANADVDYAMMRVYDSSGDLISTRKQLHSPYCPYGDADKSPTNPCYEPNLPDDTYRVEIEAFLVGGGKVTGDRTVVVGAEPSTTVAPVPSSSSSSASSASETTSSSPLPTIAPLPSATVSPSSSGPSGTTASSALVQFGDWGYTSDTQITSATMWVYNSAGTAIGSRGQQHSPYCAYGDADKTPTNPCYEPSLANGTYRVKIVANLPNGGQISAEHFVTVDSVASPTATVTTAPKPPAAAITSPTPALPTVTTTTTASGSVKAIPSDGRITSSGVYQGNISSSSGDCVVVTADNVTIKNSNIGPCNGRGVYLKGVRNFNLLSSTVDNNKAGTCCERYTTVLVSSSQNVLLQGNVLKRGESIVEVVGSTSSNVTISGNQAYDPRGPFPRGQFVQVQNNAGPITISNNTYSCRASNGCEQEDAINLYNAHDVTVEGNSVDSGGAIGRDSGCGIITESVQSVTIRNNTLRNQYHGSRGGCGIGISGGQNILVEGNDVSGYGNIAYYVAAFGSSGCNNITVRNNSAGKRPDGTTNAFWTSSSCGPNKSITGNSWQ
jgi:Right handed beta helix region